MKNVLFLTLIAAMVIICGCTPTLKPRALGAEEQEWATYLQEMYPGWKSPDLLPQAVTASSRNVPYTNIELPDQPTANSNLPVIEENAADEFTQENLTAEEPKEKEAETTVAPEGDAAKNVTDTPSEETPLDEVKKTEFTEYVVEKNDSLSTIAKKFYGDGNKFMHIYKANEDVIKDPNKLYPGMKLKIPAQK